MDRKTLIAGWKKDEAAPFSGWDFSYHAGRMRGEAPPWDYLALARAEMAQARSVLDVATGGGERFSTLAPFPSHTRATEGYGPNVFLAQSRLEPLGVQVLACEVDQLMPFTDGEFDLVLNRHGGCWNPELGRITRAGGHLLTQQVDGANLSDLLAEFGVRPQWPENTLAIVSGKFEAMGFEIVEQQDWRGRQHYLDVGALVYELKANPFLVADFSVDRHLGTLLRLQQRLETQGELSFQSGLFLIKARRH